MRFDLSRSTTALVLATTLVGALAPALEASAGSPRDFLVGPVTLAPGEALVVNAANVKASPECAEPARVAFVEHTAAGARDSSVGVATGELVRTRLGAVPLEPGRSAQVTVRGGANPETTTVQVHVETARLVLGTDPCIGIGGTVFRANGDTEEIGGVQFADDFSIFRPGSEAICIGSADCDALLKLCESAADCSFTCHVAIPDPDGQACIIGSTD